MDPNTFQNILSTTEQIIKEKGCQQTTLQDIMERTGLSKGAIYHYVKSKDELFGKILLNYMEETNHHFHEAAQQQQVPNIQGPIEAIMASYTKKDASNEILIYLLSQQHNIKIKKVLDELYENSVSLSVSWIRYGQQHGVIPADIDAESLASMLITYSYGLRVRQLIDKQPERQEPLFQEMLRLMITALKSQDNLRTN